MNKEKWIEIFYEEAQKHSAAHHIVSPKAWASMKQSLLVYIKEIDKATEVYFMENPKEKV